MEIGVALDQAEHVNEHEDARLQLLGIAPFAQLGDTGAGFLRQLAGRKGVVGEARVEKVGGDSVA